MYGKHSFGEEIDCGEVYIRCEKNYLRICKGERVEKIVSGGKGFLINPVEPVNLPVRITRTLFIEFSKTVAVEPERSVKVYLKFPVEIGVFVEGKKLYSIDVFTLSKPKFALYGDPRKGVVCKYFKSDVYESIPKVSGLEEGILELTIRNASDEWVEVKKAVFDSYGMKIYYSSFPSMVALMKVESKTIAETSFINKPVKEKMKRSVDLYSKRLVERSKFVMEWGY